MRKQEARGAVLTGYMAHKTAESEMPTVLPPVPSSGLREPQTYVRALRADGRPQVTCGVKLWQVHVGNGTRRV